MRTKRLVFAGTPEFAAVHLRRLISAGARPAAVYTQPDRPAGRGHRLTPSAVKALALSEGLEVRTPVSLKDDGEIARFAALECDLLIVVAYGLILPERLIALPRFGCVNVHASLLPRYRGAAPIQRALLEGERETGVSVMRIVKTLDAGGVYLQRRLAIAPDDTSGSLFDKLALLGSEALLEAVPRILDGTLQAEPQDESRATYARKLTKEEAPLDFKAPAEALELKIRGLQPWPVATLGCGGVRYKLLQARAVRGPGGRAGEILERGARGLVIACGSGALRVERLQAPGGKPVQAADLLRSRPDLFKTGSRCD